MSSGVRAVGRTTMGSASVAILLLASGLAGRAHAVQVSGVVTNSLNGAPVSGVAVTFTPVVPGPIVTAGNGSYTADVPSGSYTVAFSEDSYTTQNQPADTSGGPVVLDVSLVPLAPVLVGTSLTGTPAPGAALQAVGTIEILDGSSLVSVAWTQEPGGAAVQIADAGQQIADVTLPSETVYKDNLIRILAEPPVDPAANLPPGVELPPEEFHGGLQDRHEVVAVNPLMAEEAGHVALLLTVVTSSGTYTDTLDIEVALPWKVASGLRNVPIGRPVLLHTKDRPEGDTDPYDWALVRPASSSATLTDATTQDTWFTPDVEGKYTLRVTDPEDDGLIAIDVYAGTWVGAITGKDPGIDGLPLASDCTSFCHSVTTNIAPDNFADWRQSGHAEIFGDQLNASSRNQAPCWSCHAVGYDLEVDNGGLDDASDFQDFLAAGLVGGNPPVDNWSTVVNDFPDTARRANVQCESCHGPRSQLAAHGNSAVSVSLAATNCAQCHGEPRRHGRYQQWQLSGHADYELAIAREGSSDCSRCHTANGFLNWLPILLDDDPNTNPLDNITRTWTTDEVHPQTCATCHDPHDPGSQSGDPTNATVRIVGDTPPLIAGFTATDVGKGAMCMTCHNTRRGLRNDDVYPGFSASDRSRAPHPGAQADMIMGQNAFLVTVGNRGPHSNRDLSGKVADVCVDCHMEATPPPPDISYNQNGTNHTFYARKTICSTCHLDGRVADDVQQPILESLETLQTALEDGILDAIAVETEQGNSIDLNKLGTVTDVSQITLLEFVEGSGRQAITVTLGTGAPIGPVPLNSVLVRDGSDASLGSLYERSDEALPKAGWNYLLIESDGSHGIHNSEFATVVLASSIAAIQAIPEPASTAAALIALAALGGVGRFARRGSNPARA